MVKIPRSQLKRYKKWLAESKRAKLKKVLAELGEGRYTEDDDDTSASYKDHLHSAISAAAGDDSLSADQKKAKLKKFVDMMCEDDEVEDDETEDDETEDDEVEDAEEADVSQTDVEDDEVEDDEEEDEDTEEANAYGDNDDIGDDGDGDDSRGLQDKTKKKPVQGTKGPGSGTSTGTEGRKFKKSKDPAVRQLQEQLRRSNLKEWIRDHCARAKVPCTAKLLNSLIAMRKPRAIAEHIDYLKHNIKTESRIRSQGPGGGRDLEESVTTPRPTKIPAGGRKLANWLTC
jgi:hypothetical protein